MQSGPKVVVIGSGSYFFGKPVIYNMVQSPVLRQGTLALIDTDAETCETMRALAERAKAHAGAGQLKIEAGVERRALLANADFVVNSFSFRNAYYRGLDTRIAQRYGVTMCSSDTIGPGGIFRALRELPEVLAIAKDVEELAPQAWVINFVNPTTVLGMGLMRHAPQVRSFALCDGNHMPYVREHYLKMCGIVPEDTPRLDPRYKELDAKLELEIAGVNHCTWALKCAFEGKDMMPAIKAYVDRKACQEYDNAPSEKAKPRLNMNYCQQLMDIYGCYPTAVSHTKEYVPFFQGYGVSPNLPEPVIAFDAYNRADEMAAAWKITQAYAKGEKPMQEFFEQGHGDHATDIIEAMWSNSGKKFYINSANRGAVANLPDDAFLELLCKVDMNGPLPLKLESKMPRGLLGLTQQVLDTHELTVEASMSKDRKTLLKAMLTDPIINNIGDARRIMEELLEAEADHLEGWN
ncbi:MAG: glycoside hydrolase family 4 [Lentisphaeria bacterium]|nr:glycoside hydrolase family 4 [Lentisphaeria bacterium]